MTNITEFLGRELLCVLPAVCGMRAEGSDYELFRAFCRGAERFPDCADVRRVREILQACFSCNMVPNAANCDAIWQVTADSLLTSGAPAEHPKRSEKLPCPPLPHFEGAVVDCPALAGADSWSAWETNAKSALAGARAVRVVLPVGFRAEKTSLWRAEHILRGECKDLFSAAAQQIDFLTGVCSADCRMVLETACGAEEVLRQLTLTARRREIPPLVWNFAPDAGPDRAILLAVLQLVRAPQGVPPVLTSRTA